MKTRAKLHAGERLCLRCDWTGSTADPVCPSCGAALWAPRRPVPPKPPSRLARALARRAARAERAERIATGFTAAAPAPAEDPRERALAADRRGRRRGWLAVTIVVAVAVVAVAIVRAGTPSKPALASTAVIGGRLLYVAVDPGTGDPRIFVWNLETGVVEPGPLLEDEPISMIRASVAGDEAVGMIVDDRITGPRAELVRHVEETDVPATVLEGDLVAWEFGGGSAASATITPGGRCDQVTFDRFDGETISVGRTWGGPICGEITALHRTDAATWVSLADHRRSEFRADAVAAIGSGGMQPPALPGMRLVGSGLVDLYAVPTDQGSAPVLHGRGNRTANPLLVYRDGGRPLLVERFLALTFEGDGAYVLGSIGGVRGIYRVTGPSDILNEAVTPRLVMETDAAADDLVVTESIERVPIVSFGGSLSAVGAQGVDRLSVPDDAPTPEAGPILWLLRDEPA
jgi:hypothetical protein